MASRAHAAGSLCCLASRRQRAGPPRSGPLARPGPSLAGSCFALPQRCSAYCMLRSSRRLNLLRHAPLCMAQGCHAPVGTASLPAAARGRTALPPTAAPARFFPVAGLTPASQRALRRPGPWALGPHAPPCASLVTRFASLVPPPAACAARLLASAFAGSCSGPRPPCAIARAARPLPPPRSRLRRMRAGALTRLLMAAPLDAACSAFALSMPRASADSLLPPPQRGDALGCPRSGGPLALCCTAMSFGISASSPCCSASPSHGRYLECNFESPPFVDPCIVPLSRNARRLRPAGLWPASRRLSR